MLWLGRAILLVQLALGQSTESLACNGYRFLVGNVSGNRQNHVAGTVHGLEKCQQVVALNIAQHLIGANAPALHPVLREGGGVHALHRHWGRIVQLAVGLFNHHLGFFSQLGRVKQGIGDCIGLDLYRFAKTLFGHNKVVVGAVIDRASIGLATNGRQLLRNLFCARKQFGTLEEHVLKQMRHTCDLVRLIEVAGLDPGIDSHDTSALLRLGDDGQAIGQNCLFDVLHEVVHDGSASRCGGTGGAGTEQGQGNESSG